jgi:hypothetical protein
VAAHWNWPGALLVLLLTVTVMLEDSVVLPAASYALAAKVWLPLGALAVFHETL